MTGLSGAFSLMCVEGKEYREVEEAGDLSGGECHYPPPVFLRSNYSNKAHTNKGVIKIYNIFNLFTNDDVSYYVNIFIGSVFSIYTAFLFFPLVLFFLLFCWGEF